MKYLDFKTPVTSLKPEIKQGKRFHIALTLPKRTHKLFKFIAAHRLISFSFAVLIFLSLLIPLADHSFTSARYKLSSKTSELLGSTSPKLAEKISYDAKAELYQFNKEAKKQEGAPTDPSIQAGSKSYAADLPKDPSKGITLYDTVNNLSISFTPQFKTLEAKQDINRFIYPINSSSGQMVYTAKANGIKEDILLTKSGKDTQSFSYKLNLNDDLEARLTPDGGVGVYSADPTLFGNISFGSDADQQKVEAARKNGKKDNLVFEIPSPIIKQTGKGTDSAKAHFELKDNVLTVKAEHLKQASYPLSIDPTFIVTSSSDWTKGNNEGGVDTSGNDLIRSGLTGGTVGAWSASASVPSTFGIQAAATYNGKIYLMGGVSGGGSVDIVEFATINGDGTLSNWTKTTKLPSVRYWHGGFAHNGYLYTIGGFDSTTTVSTNYYAPINGDGTVGSWNTTSALPSARERFGLAVYNGKVYVSGGCSVDASCPTTGTNVSNVYYATINGDGTLSSWASTTSLPAARAAHTMASGNGYVYVIGGYTGAYENSVLRAQINGDGTLGSWGTSGVSTLPVTLGYHSSTVANGYLYVIAGYNVPNVVATTYYAQMNGDGTLGSWNTGGNLATARYLIAATTSGNNIYALSGYDNAGLNNLAVAEMATSGSGGAVSWQNVALPVSGRAYGGTVVQNGYIYLVGGKGTNLYLSAVSYAPIATDGTIGIWLSTTNLPVIVGFHGTLANNGYIYVLGGYANGTFGNTVYYAKQNTDGSLGAWNTTTSFTTPRYGLAAVSYNGYAYVSGGCTALDILGACNTNTNTVYYAKFNANGTLGSWVSTTAMPTTRYDHMSIAYNGYIYIIAGLNVAAGLTDVQVAKINSDGTIGSWVSTSAFSVYHYVSAVVAVSGYLYVLGGNVNGVYSTEVSYASINANGTIGNWRTTTAMPIGVAGLGAVAMGNKIITFGGDNNGPLTEKSYITTISSAGSLDNSWQTDSTGTITNARWVHATVVYNSYVYVSGGCKTDCTTDVDVLGDIQYAPINSDGTLGSWATSVNTFGTNRAAHQMLAYDGYLYILGGYGRSVLNAAEDYNDIQYSAIATDGSLGSFSTNSVLNNFSNARFHFYATISGGRMYVMGGCVGAVSTCTASTNTQYASINSDRSVGSGTWATGASLAQATYAGAMARYGNTVYITGGYDNTNLLSYIQYSTIASDGSLGTWTHQTNDNLPEARYYHWAIAAKGFLYVGNGCSTANCSSMLTSVKYAPISSDGSLGTWTTAASTNENRTYAPAVIAKDIIYVPAGCSVGICTTAKNDTTYIQLNNGGPGTLAAWTTDSHTFANGRYTHCSAAYNGYLYVVGGNNDGGGLTSVQYAPINADGSVGSFSAAANLNSSTGNGSGARALCEVYNGYIYTTDGNTMQYASLGSNGNITSWSNGAVSSGVGASAVYNGYLYWLSGTTVQYSQIASDHSPGTWASTTSLPSQVTGIAWAMAYNGYLYAIGVNSNSDLVYSAVINSNGTVGSWQLVGSTQLYRIQSGAAIYNGNLYLFSGVTTGSAYTSTAEVAPLLAGGKLGSWQLTTGFGSRRQMGVAQYNGYLYSTGGDDGGREADVNYTFFQSIPRKGTYSKLLDCDLDCTPTKLLTNGTLGNPNSVVSNNYACATNASPTFGSTTSSTVTLSGLITIPYQIKRYCWLSYTLDDSLSAVFPDSNQTSLSDFNLYYHPASSKRLRGGKTFTGGNQQSLDAQP